MPTVTVSLWQSAVDGILKFVKQTGQQAVIQNVSLRAPKAGSTTDELLENLLNNSES